MNDNGDSTKEKIVAAVRERPMGLTILDIAAAIGAHRQTVAKYLLVLEAEGAIQRRSVGSAVLHYPKSVSLEIKPIKGVKRGKGK